MFLRSVAQQNILFTIIGHIVHIISRVRFTLDSFPYDPCAVTSGELLSTLSWCISALSFAVCKATNLPYVVVIYTRFIFCILSPSTRSYSVTCSWDGWKYGNSRRSTIRLPGRVVGPLFLTQPHTPPSHHAPIAFPTTPPYPPPALYFVIPSTPSLL